MKKILLLLFATLYFAGLFAQNNNAEFKKQVKALNKVVQGLYEVRQTGDDVPEAQRQQDLLLFPLTHWTTEEEAWLCFIWLSPKFKDRPLEQVFIKLTYKDAQTMNALYYSFPENAPEGLSQEWKKPKPFAPMTADFVVSESPACDGFISWDADGVYKMESYEPCPRNTKGAAYTSVQIDSRFYGKTYSSGIKFYASDAKIIMQHTHDFKSKKASANVKKY